jgi:ketosteroid isomerase-like protein
MMSHLLRPHSSTFGLPALTRAGAVCVALMASACATVSTPAAAIHERTEEMVETANRGDVTALIREFYAREPIIAFGGSIRKGHEASAQAWKEMLNNGTIEIETDRLETSCDLASEMGEWTLRVKADEGDYRQEKGRYFATWKKENGRWKVVMQTFTPEGFHEAE